MSTPYELAHDWLMNNLEQVVAHLFPAGRVQGNEFLVGDLEGNAGDSLHITLKGKRGFWKDFATGDPGSRSVCKLWKQARKISDTDHQSFFEHLENFSGQSFGYTPPGAALDWPKCLADWSAADSAKLVKLRGYTPAFVDWLHDVNHGVGRQYGRIVFPIVGPGGVVVGLHRYFEQEKKLKFSKGCKVYPLVFGDMGPVTELHVHESRWDCYALASATGWHLKPGVRFLATCGAGNGKLIKGQVPKGARVHAWEQHDQPDQNGRIPNEEWFKDLAADAGCQIDRVRLPARYKDLNDWTRDGVSEPALAAASAAAQPYQRATATAQVPSKTSQLFPPLK